MDGGRKQSWLAEAKASNILICMSPLMAVKRRTLDARAVPGYGPRLFDEAGPGLSEFFIRKQAQAELSHWAQRLAVQEQ